MKTTSVFLFSFVLLMTSCEPKPVEQDATISTNVIDVPATASGKPVNPGSAPVMVFNEETHDFGKITQGEKVSYSFIFKNLGGSDLVISSAQGSCGCTIPSYPKTAIKPNQQSTVDVVFDSDGKSGIVQKTVTMITNCNPSTKVITITANIQVPEENK